VNEITRLLDMNNTVMVVVSDHGWDIGQKEKESSDLWRATSPHRDANIMTEYFGKVHINAPWCIYLSNISWPVTYQIDIPVAILKELGIAIPDYMRSSL
jgi:hypothetical protein